MTIEELKAAVANRVKFLDEYQVLKWMPSEACVQMVMPMPKNFYKAGRSYSQRVKTPFGLCSWYPHKGHEILINPTIAQVEAYIKKAESV